MNRLTFLAITALVTLSASHPKRAAQQASQQETPPAPGTPRNFRVPPHQTTTLPNGMQITLIPFGTVPKVTMDLQIRTGVIDEGPNDVSLASVVGDMLLEGTATRSSLDISRQAAEMGGAIASTWGSEVSSVSGEVLSNFAPQFAALMADVALHPRFDAADFTRVIGQHARNNAIALAQADNLVTKKFREIMYGDHPFAHIYPSDSVLHGFTVARARDFYTKNYSAKRAHLYISGVFDAKAMLKAVTDAFSGWPAGAPPTERPPVIATKQQVAVIDRAQSVQSAVIMGVAAPDPSKPDWVKMNVTDAILGGAFGSRITTNIREDKGYTYSPFSQITARKGAAIWSETADVTTNVTGASLTEIVKEIDRLRAEAPPAKELDGIKNNMAGIFTIQNSNRAGLIGQMEFVNLHGLSDDYVTSYVKNVLAVSPEDVRATAEKYIVPSKMSIAIVGDKKLVDAQLGKMKPIIP